MLITHVQAYSSGGDSIHVQATGPAFPTGYTSCDLECEDAVRAVKSAEANSTRRLPSMRPCSGMRYIKLFIEDGDVYAAPPSDASYVCSLDTLFDALSAPSPAYSDTDATNVAARVNAAVAAASAPQAKPSNTNELKELRTQVRDILSKLNSLLDESDEEEDDDF